MNDYTYKYEGKCYGNNIHEVELFVGLKLLQFFVEATTKEGRTPFTDRLTINAAVDLVEKSEEESEGKKD
jgi:hypothetical protein